MIMNPVLEIIGQYRLLPVLTVEDTDRSQRLAEALIEGGLPIAEVTFRASRADTVIASMLRIYPDMVVGAGTVLCVEQAKQAIDAGARFIVSPGLNPEVVNYCLDNGVTVIPGCVTPTEIETALRLGVDTVKFFPAEVFGGAAAIRALSAPYRDVSFIPTGGIGTYNIGEYLRCPSVLACGGSFMAEPALIREGAFTRITALTRAALEAAR